MSHHYLAKKTVICIAAVFIGFIGFPIKQHEAFQSIFFTLHTHSMHESYIIAINKDCFSFDEK
jgi:hypothetical protein